MEEDTPDKKEGTAEAKGKIGESDDDDSDENEVSEALGFFEGGMTVCRFID